nr:MAG TPA: hypothetical protein [Caudoviricetes sp.]
MNSYEVKINYSNKELTARERIKLKDTTNAVSLDEATEGSSLVISPCIWAQLGIHNERNKGGNVDYIKYIIIDEAGTKYVTGSESFWTSFIEIATEMNGEQFDVEAYKVDSKNYKGKQFISCSIV